MDPAMLDRRLAVLATHQNEGKRILTEHHAGMTAAATGASGQDLL
jgi:hypothetical protein